MMQGGRWFTGPRATSRSTELKRAEMVVRGTQRLVEVENSIGAAFSTTARLAGDLEDLRMSSGLSAVIGQDALSDVSRAVSLLVEARGVIVRAHGHLDAVKTQIGCRSVTLTGNGTDKGNTDDPTGPPHTGRLRAV